MRQFCARICLCWGRKWEIILNFVDSFSCSTFTFASWSDLPSWAPQNVWHTIFAVKSQTSVTLQRRCQTSCLSFIKGITPQHHLWWLNSYCNITCCAHGGAFHSRIKFCIHLHINFNSHCSITLFLFDLSNSNHWDDKCNHRFRSRRCPQTLAKKSNRGTEIRFNSCIKTDYNYLYMGLDNKSMLYRIVIWDKISWQILDIVLSWVSSFPG